MSKLEWNRPQDQSFETGLDRGVLYVEDGAAVAWSGLVSVDDSGESTVKELYLDGIKFLTTISPRDWKGALSAYTFPPEFSEVMGVSELGDGLYVDSQAPGRFGLSYRTMISTPGVDTTQHYKIHLIYKAMASFSGLTHQTLTSNGVDPTQFSFDLSAVPILIPGHRPSAHIIIDTRTLDETTISNLETLLYGDVNQVAQMPSVDLLIDLLRYSGEVTVIDNGDGTWTASGSSADVRLVDNKGHFQIDNVDASYLTSDLYRFFGDDTVDGLILVVDQDGVPYYRLADLSSGTANIGIDEDGIPYFELGVFGAVLAEDEDGTLYFAYDLG